MLISSRKAPVPERAGSAAMRELESRVRHVVPFNIPLGQLLSSSRL